MRLDRRTLLVGGGAGLGLLVAYAAWPRRYGSGLQPRGGERVFGPYLKIAPDGRVTVAVPQVETGQGVWTALPQILADELGAAWETVAVEPAPAGPHYGNALRAELRAYEFEELERVTAGATSVRAFEQPLRQAGAAARAMLCAEAGRRWGVTAAECDTEAGFVTHEGKRLPFGELAEAAAQRSPPNGATLRPAGSGKLLGQSLPRLDLPPKSDGSFRFAGDVRLPGLRYAAAALVPDGGRLTGYDRNVRNIVAGDQWLAAVGDTSWAAAERLKRAAPRIAGPASANSAAISEMLGDLLAGGEAEVLLERGDLGAARGRQVEGLYRLEPALHLGLEPLTATARYRNGKLEVWAPSQSPDRTREIAARAAGLPVTDVLLYPMPVGAPDGRALNADAAPIAAALARRTGAPIQLAIAPGQSLRHDRPRAPAAVRCRATLGPDNYPLAWEERRAGGEGSEPAFPYAVPALRLEQARADLPIATGYLRGGNAAVAAFARECFLDELARAGGFEPLAFRIALLGGQPRLAQVLQTAAAIGGWDGGGPGSGMGLACLSAYGSHIALLASASIGPDQKVRADRLVAAVDCGRAVNPGLVRQQVEGGLLAGLARATATAATIRAGLVDGAVSAAPRLARTPEIVVEIVGSRAGPGGVSGLGDAVLAPAVANAVASATGRRLRSLPFDPMSAA
uniref:molybdopterin cofactor-binding domain-containing protein n=1 Tax=uncultured Sphingomonas sp. TaxID=158754 RepID=UPI0025CC332F|nr:molybdopterin cofactor-binding domain-containing protein [uncultured Sphingomonas sp.]